MGSDDACKLPRLALGLGFGFDQNDQQIFNNKDKQDKEKNGMVLKFDHVLPCLSLGSPALPPGDRGSSVSPGSSDTNSSTVKREKANGDDLLDGVGKAVSSRASDEDEEGSPRKKLRLTKEQSVVLEDSFKEHNTLNPNQKQALARQLNLRPRQVEVWFQNRRARTKLKQTEMDCELLKKCCENLTEENKRLQRELQDLRALKLPSPGNSPIPAIFMQMPAATLTICPSCERLNAGGGRGSGTGAGAGSGDNGIKGPICNPFDRSAAC